MLGILCLLCWSMENLVDIGHRSIQVRLDCTYVVCRLGKVLRKLSIFRFVFIEPWLQKTQDLHLAKRDFFLQLARNIILSFPGISYESALSEDYVQSFCTTLMFVYNF
uniref:Uncharacterized protein n=1 Tax=Cacopsylla melanoneura TaxID=428564 RepID=A0A8D8ZD26_9HEMI